MNIIRRIVKAGEQIPWGYGMAWRNWPTADFVFYPFPLNHVLAYLRDRWMRMRHNGRTKLVTTVEADHAVVEAYARGFAAGKAKR